MEKLILFLFVLGIGSFYEYLKQKREQRAKNSVSSQPRQRPRPMQPQQSAQSLNMDPKPRPVKKAPPSLPEEGQSVLKDIPKVQQTKKTQKPKADRPAESPVFATPKPDPELQKHYERWRRAIIDTEILQRKF